MVMPYGDIDLGQYLLRWWLVAANTDTLKVVGGIHLREISKELIMNLIHYMCFELMNLIHNMSFEIILTVKSLI